MVSLLVGLLALPVGTLLHLLAMRMDRWRVGARWLRCLGCGRPVTWWAALPLLGVLVQRGRTGCCRRRLDHLVPLCEVWAALSVLALLESGANSPWQLARDALIATTCLTTALIDWRFRHVDPRWLSLATLGLLLLAPAAGIAWLDAGLGMLFGAMLFAGFVRLGAALFPAGPTPLGAGDVVIAAFIGAAAGVTHLALALLPGMLLAGGYAAWLMVVHRAAARRRVFAYGAWLCVGAWLALVIWPSG
jgi:leader peptidase (prepilin peptidase)/N-methyltransferase